MKEVPKFLLREFPKIVLVEASNAVFGEKKEFYEGTLRMWCQKWLSSEFSKQSPRREDMKRGLEGRALEDRGFEKSREKGFRERSFKVHTERS